MKPENDRRYRMLVNLVRTDRPNYWTWHCPHCQMRVAEIANGEVLSVTDLIDMNNIDKLMVGLRCNGRSPTGMGRCDFWYYFNVSEKPSRRV